MKNESTCFGTTTLPKKSGHLHVMFNWPPIKAIMKNENNEKWEAPKSLYRD